MNVAVYVRVSTQRQQQTQTIEQQIERLQSHAAVQGWQDADQSSLYGHGLLQPPPQRTSDSASDSTPAGGGGDQLSV